MCCRMVRILHWGHLNHYGLSWSSENCITYRDTFIQHSRLWILNIYFMLKEKKHKLSAVNGCVRREIFITNSDERLTFERLAKPWPGKNKATTQRDSWSRGRHSTGAGHCLWSRTQNLQTFLFYMTIYLIFSLQNKSTYCSILFYLKNNLNVFEQLRTCWPVIFFFNFI